MRSLSEGFRSLSTRLRNSRAGGFSPTRRFSECLLVPKLPGTGLQSLSCYRAVSAWVIRSIRYGEVRRQIENSVIPVVIDVDPNISKFRIRRSFAIGQECVNLIKVMMKNREPWGEKIEDESILFRSLGVGTRMIDGNMVPGGAVDRSQRGNPICTRQIGWDMIKAATDRGVTLHTINNTNFPLWEGLRASPTRIQTLVEKHDEKGRRQRPRVSRLHHGPS